MGIQLGRVIISGEALQRILDFLPYPFLVARLKDDVRHNAYLNQKFIDEIGYTLDEIPTIKEWFQFAYPDPEYRRQVENTWATSQQQANENKIDSVSMQVRIRTKYATDRWYEVKASTGDPQMVAFIDIQATKAQEENLKMLNQNRDRVLSVLGHDLRGPMNQLYALSQMASKKMISQEEFTKMIGDVNDRALQCMEFLSTTLTWARSNFDFIRVKSEEIEMKALVEEVVSLYQASYSSKSITMNLSVEDSYRLFADREIIITVLRNLISNAIKFTNQNGSIEVMAHQVDGAKHIVVKDSGIGMDESTAKRILSSNYSSSIGTQGEKGLGIGIMLCNDLLKRMGALLHVESAPGKGTAMKIIIAD